MSSAWPHPACLPDEQLLRDCDRRTQRASGPGGQHRNKTETAVVLTHRPTGLKGRASERRSQHANAGQALRRLRETLAVEHRTATDADHARSELWSSRCRGGRISVNPKHADHPALVAEAMDVLAALDWDGGAATERLGCSTSQLVRLLRGLPSALARWNAERGARKLRPLK